MRGHMKKRNDTSRGERGGSLWKSRIIGGIVAAVIVLVMFWFMLPPINLTSPSSGGSPYCP